MLDEAVMRAIERGCEGVEVGDVLPDMPAADPAPGSGPDL
jgi:hypothetical protein